MTIAELGYKERIIEEALKIVTAGWVKGSWILGTSEEYDEPVEFGIDRAAKQYEGDVIIGACSIGAMRIAAARVLGLSSEVDVVTHPEYKEAVLLVSRTIYEMEEELTRQVFAALEDGDKFPFDRVESTIIEWNDDESSRGATKPKVEKFFAAALEAAKAS